MADFKVIGDGNARHDRHLSNLYAYFWRWATWKAFESTNNPDTPQGDEGVISFITASGYLSSPGFRGMRKYLREKCSHGWIINLTPEGINSPNNVFDISTPVVIAIFVRTENTSSNSPAEINYIDISGTREEKYEKLSRLELSDSSWRKVRDSWTDPFTPAPNNMWDHYPATGDIFPWRANGIMTGRNWVYATTENTLHERLSAVTHQSDMNIKSKMFKEGSGISLETSKEPLPGVDVEKNTRTPFKNNLVYLNDSAIVRCGYRFLDRQYLIADSRLINRPSPTLWHGRISGQVFSYELHSEFPRRGPAMVYSALIPDVHFFRGSGGGRSIPKFHPNGDLNIAPGLHEALQSVLGSMISESDIFDYVAGITGHSGFVDYFEDELQTPESRVPITKNPQLWSKAVMYGRYVQWLHTFGESGEHPNGLTKIRDALNTNLLPKYEKSIGSAAPSKNTIRYEPSTKTLHIGEGLWSNISEEVWDYSVGGNKVLKRWLEQRCISPKKNVNSPLDLIVEKNWLPEWSEELDKVISIIALLVDIEKDMETLLKDIMKNDIFTKDELSSNGVQWPESDKDRVPHRSLNDGDEGTLPF
ncbi:type ISP restriction/modification enzyme [Rothia nasimurium]|uniref:type ISP restriction/modification enzyme n=1 Tax=Rothia nasimurium TaxID=85336 RepID=UPI00361F3B7D